MGYDRYPHSALADLETCSAGRIFCPDAAAFKSSDLAISPTIRRACESSSTIFVLMHSLPVAAKVFAARTLAATLPGLRSSAGSMPPSNFAFSSSRFARASLSETAENAPALGDCLTPLGGLRKRSVYTLPVPPAPNALHVDLAMIWREATLYLLALLRNIGFQFFPDCHFRRQAL